MIRYLAHKTNPLTISTELDWINGRVRILGESYGRATREIQSMIDDGTMLVVAEKDQVQ